MLNLKTPISRLRAIGIVEGISFLILLFIAMPLKYLMQKPQAVSVVGMAHGVLFLVFLVALIDAKLAHRWGAKKALVPFLASLIPFGPFVIDRRLKEEDEARREGDPAT